MKTNINNPLDLQQFKSDESVSKVSTSSGEERDEIKEIKQLARADTDRIRLWRWVVLGSLLVTGAVVSGLTYHFLEQEKQQTLETAFDQFSRTVGDAALQQQFNIRAGLNSITDDITNYAVAVNTTWPFFIYPNFEKRAQHLRIQTGLEIISMRHTVPAAQVPAWLDFANAHYEAWVKESHLWQEGNLNRLIPEAYHPFVSRYSAEVQDFVPDFDNRTNYYPSWMFSPPPKTYGMINANLLSDPLYNSLLQAMFKMRNETVTSLVRPYTIAVPMAMTAEEHQAMHSQINPSSVSEHPHSFYFNNIFEEVGNTNSRIVAAIGGGVAWDYSLRNLLPDTVRGLMVVIKNSCDQAFTYRIDGKDAFFVGEGDQHNTKYTLEKEVDLAIHNNPEFFDTPDHCWYRLHIFPGEEFEATYETHTPIIYAIVLVVTFLVVIAVFIIYDKLVYKRNEKMIGSAARSNAIVSSLFPGNIRDRLMAQGTDGDSESDGMGQLVDRSSKPLADFFLETTVLFADIVGFTAWSSVRDPSQVFTLLEEIYRAFDELARRRRIYKVETVGDCYVAVAGLPEPRADHAVAMVQFAERILKRMDEVTKELEVSLGPDTSDLSLRIGIHSGPVTAGVLRGERARFQLFGDTVNTCSRMESTGSPGRIHISEDTANLIQKFGKGHWLEKRADAVAAKGKGLLQTYWVNYGTTAVETDIPASKVKANQEQHTERLIDWNATVLLDILREIMVKRGDKATSVVTTSEDIAKKATPLEEVKEVIELPKFKVGAADMTKVDLSQEVVDEVHAFVKRIAGMYLNNPFHCFDHASHVVMSVTKLLGRIVAPKQSDLGLQEQANLVDVAVTLHDHTYGITSDPLTQFACAFSALIHDVDHQGIPNPQLCKEQPALAEQYKKRSVAEQNSLDLSWDLLMQDEFAHFRSALCATKHDLQHFRNLVVNSVMATDIMDKELKELRNNRWKCAFNGEDTSREAVNRKATIVIEHLIQASDVSHTMQHWHIYRKWNQRLFHELYQAYVDGRAHKDPSLFWYKGEIGFFDFYIIPLAKKLKDCGVFGVSSDEFLSYALQNRNEWEERGQGIVSEMMQELKATPTASGSK